MHPRLGVVRWKHALALLERLAPITLPLLR